MIVKIDLRWFHLNTLIEKTKKYTNETFTTGDHIGILLDSSASTIKISKGKKEVKKFQLKSHFMSKDLYPCVGFKDFNGGSLRLVAAKTGNQKFYLSKFPIAI